VPARARPPQGDRPARGADEDEPCPDGGGAAVKLPGRPLTRGADLFAQGLQFLSEEGALCPTTAPRVLSDAQRSL
jgi:hypothetical protein